MTTNFIKINPVKEKFYPFLNGWIVDATFLTGDKFPCFLTTPSAVSLYIEKVLSDANHINIKEPT